MLVGDGWWFQISILPYLVHNPFKWVQLTSCGMGWKLKPPFSSTFNLLQCLVMTLCWPHFASQGVFDMLQQFDRSEFMSNSTIMQQVPACLERLGMFGRSGNVLDTRGTHLDMRDKPKDRLCPGPAQTSSQSSSRMNTKYTNQISCARVSFAREMRWTSCSLPTNFRKKLCRLRIWGSQLHCRWKHTLVGSSWLVMAGVKFGGSKFIQDPGDPGVHTLCSFS